VFFQIAAQDKVPAPELLQRRWGQLDRRLADAFDAIDDGGLPAEFQPPHIAYAWAWETTRVVEVFRRVVEAHVEGERLGIPASPEARRWVEITEDLVYTDQPPGAALSLTSWLRPDAQAVRRNAYYRMFGGLVGEGVPNVGTANAGFPVLFHHLLEQVWIGITNRTNTSGANPTDNSRIAEKALRLFEMLTARRREGNLRQEEFASVATMAWLHLTLSFDSPIIVSLTAQGPSPAERLQAVGGRVDLMPDPRVVSLIELAEPMSDLLRLIETGAFNEPEEAAQLYEDDDIRNTASLVINHWAAVTGLDPRAKPVQAEPVVMPAAPAPALLSPATGGPPA